MSPKTYEVKLSDGRVVDIEIDVPEGWSDDQILEFIQSQDINSLVKPEYQSESEIPLADEIGLPFKEKPQEERSLSEFLEGIKETGDTLITGATLGTPAYVAGILQQLSEEIATGKIGTQESAQRVQDFANQYMQMATTMPKTEAGQEYLGNVSEVAEGLIPVAPQLAELSFLRPNLPKTPTKKELIANKVINEQSDLTTQGFKRARDISVKGDVPTLLPPKVVKTGMNKELIKVGFDENLPPALRNYTKTPDKAAFKKMVDIAETMMFQDAMKAQRNNPLDVAGMTLKKRYDFVSDLVRKSGREVGREGQNLKGVLVDYAPVIDNFMTNLQELGIKINTRDLSLDFTGSQLRGKTLRPLQHKIKDVVDYMRTAGEVDAFKAHQLKKYIDEIVDFDKLGKGASASVENVLKSLRHDINKILQDASPAYKKANQTYSDAIQAKELFESIMGKKINFKDPDSSRRVGSELRKLGSNYAKKYDIENLINDLGGIEKVANKYGAGFDDNVELQALFAIAMNQRFGLQRKNTFQQLSKQGMTDAMIDMGVSGNVVNAGTIQGGRAAMRFWKELRGKDDKSALEVVKRFIEDLEDK